MKKESRRTEVKMNNSQQVITNTIRWLAVGFVIISMLLLIGTIGFIVVDKEIIAWFTKIDLPKAALLGGYIGGFIGVFWAATGSLLIFLNLNEQKQQFNKNQIDSSFFNLMNFYFESLKEITGEKEFYSPAEGEYRGRRYLRYAHDDLKLILERKKSALTNTNKGLYDLIETKNIEKIDSKTIEELRNFLTEIYNGFYDKRKSQLGHYFRLIFNIIQYIDESGVTWKEKIKYVNLIQAQMSDVELGLIFYNGLTEKGRKLFNYLEDYSFLENISEDGIIFSINKILYPKTKFKF
jgi:hypothetical protein